MGRGPSGDCRAGRRPVYAGSDLEAIAPRAWGAASAFEEASSKLGFANGVVFCLSDEPGTCSLVPRRGQRLLSETRATCFLYSV